MSDEKNNKATYLELTTLTVANCKDRETKETESSHTFYVNFRAEDESIEKVGKALSSIFKDGTSKVKKHYYLGYAKKPVAPAPPVFVPPTDIDFGNGIDLYQDWTYTLNEDDTVTLIKCLKEDSVEEIIIPKELYLIDHVIKKVKTVKPYALSSLLSDTQIKSIKRVIFSEGIEELINGFYKSNLIEEITLPISLKTISGECFNSCSNLTTINNFPQDITDINNFMFYGCSSLSNIDIPNTINTVGSYSFYNCQALDIPLSLIKSLSKINEYAFYNCYKLNGKDIVLNDNVTTIGSYAFQDCNLREVRIPNTVTKIGTEIFKGNSSLEKIIIEGNNLYAYDVLKLNYPLIIEYLGDDLEEDKEIVEEEGDIIGSYENFTIALNTGKSTYKITRCVPKPINGVVTIPNKIRLSDGSLVIVDTVHSTGSYHIFTTATGIEKIVVAKGIKTIGAYSFYKIINLKEVVLPSTLESIGNSCFEGSTNLREVIINGNIESIPNNCFKSTSISSITLPNTVNSIGSNAFYECKILESVQGLNIETIGDKAFYKCESLNKIDLENVVTIGDSAFYNCFALLKAHLNNIISIGEGAFYCSPLQDVILSGTLREVGNYAFYGAIFQELYIPSSLKTIGGTSSFDTYNFNSKFYVEEGNELVYNHLVQKHGEEKVKYVSSSEMPILEFNIEPLSSSIKDAKEVEEEINQEIEEVISDDSIWAYEIIENNNIALIKYLSTEETKKIIIPNKLIVGDNLYTVKEIKGFNSTYGAFNKTVYDNVEVIKVSDGIEIIGHGVFYGLKNLKKVILPKSLKKIGSYAFYNCISLLSVNSNDLVNIHHIGAYSFYNCTSLKRFYMPPSVKTLGAYTFYGCTSLQTLYLRDVEIINSYALNNCTSLVNIDFSKARIFAPYCCYKIATTKADLRSAKVIGENVFKLSSLKEINFNVNTMATLVSWSFAETKLVNVYLPKYISVVGYLTFIDISTLKKVYVQRGNDKTYNYLIESTGVKSKAQFTEDSSFRPLEEVNIVEDEWIDDFIEEES